MECYSQEVPIADSKISSAQVHSNLRDFILYSLGQLPSSESQIEHVSHRAQIIFIARERISIARIEMTKQWKRRYLIGFSPRDNER